MSFEDFASKDAGGGRELPPADLSLGIRLRKISIRRFQHLVLIPMPKLSSQRRILRIPNIDRVNPIVFYRTLVHPIRTGIPELDHVTFLLCAA
jgi:hypothetical protein